MSRPADSLSQARAFQGALLELIPLARALDREVAAVHGLSAAQGLALRLWSEGESLTVSDLAIRLRLDKSTASRLAAGLERKGYLGRARDRADGRVVWLEATPDGHRLRVRLEEERALRYAEVLGAFDPEVRIAMTRLLSRLAASFADQVGATEGNSRPPG